MNYKSIILSIGLVAGLVPNALVSMQKPAFYSQWLSKAKVSEIAQQITNSRVYEYAKEHKAALLGAAALTTAGIFAYKYFFKKPSNQEIKAKIKSETLKIIIPHATNVKNGIVSPFFCRNKRSTPAHLGDYEMTIRPLVQQNKTCGIRATYVYQCDNTSDFVDILFQ